MIEMLVGCGAADFWPSTVYAISINHRCRSHEEMALGFDFSSTTVFSTGLADLLVSAGGCRRLQSSE